ncbi:MAG: hypothetical protein ACI4NN_07885 [Pyramidobacter sp.]|jgi:hypothetical protein
MDLNAQWKKGCIHIGMPTNLLAAATSFLPVLWLCATYDCWPDMNVLLKAWGLVAASFGAFYFVEPISYYSIIGLSGSYLVFLSGNIGNMRVPCAALALDATHTESGTLQAEIVSTLGICGSIITNLIAVLLAACVGASVVAVLPKVVSDAFIKYTAGAIFGATFGNFSLKYPKIAVFAAAIAVVMVFLLKTPAYMSILVSVFGSIAIARVLYKMERRAE